MHAHICVVERGEHQASSLVTDHFIFEDKITELGAP